MSIDYQYILGQILSLAQVFQRIIGCSINLPDCIWIFLHAMMVIEKLMITICICSSAFDHLIPDAIGLIG
jgi:hypothetical protein